MTIITIKTKNDHEADCTCPVLAPVFLIMSLGLQMPQWFFGAFIQIPGQNYSVRAEIYQLVALTLGALFVTLFLVTFSSFHVKTKLHLQISGEQLRNKFILLYCLLSVTGIANILAVSASIPYLQNMPNFSGTIILVPTLLGGILSLFAALLVPHQLRSTLRNLDSAKILPNVD